MSPERALDREARVARATIPARLNLFLLVVASCTCAALLAAASHAPNIWLAVACAVAFSYTANTVFSLLHEAVHGILHPNANVNRWAGRVAAAFFPTALSIQRGYHLTHHRNNRTPLERFDYLQPGDRVWLKRAQWYSILTGFYWVVSVVGVLVYLIAPWTLRSERLRSRSSQTAQQTSSVAYLAVLDSIDPVTARLEILLSISIQALMFYALDLRIGAWLLCYGAFALQWSALQYADHAFSPLDEKEGAWNLRVNRLTRALFLNYHLHLAHHRNPQVPWIHLNRLVDQSKPQPSYLRMWFSMWRGPRPLP